MAPAYTIVGRPRPVRSESRPPPTTYNQIHGTIEEEQVERLRKQESKKATLKMQRERYKEELKKRKEEQMRKEEEESDESPKMEALQLQITETRTKSERLEIPQVQEPQKESNGKITKPQARHFEVPGPGQYEMAKPWIQHNKGSSFGLHGPEFTGKYNMLKFTPGPGSFEVRAERSNIGYSFGDRPQDSFSHSELKIRRQIVEKKENMPDFIAAPSFFGKSAGVKFNPPRSKSQIQRGFSVGPASYYPPNIYTGQSFSMGGRIQINQRKTVVPGPGEYEVDTAMSYFSSGMAKTMSGRWTEKKLQPGGVGPGPTTYNISTSTKYIPGPRIVKHSTKPRAPKQRERSVSFVRSISDVRNAETSTHGTFGKGPRSEVAPKTITPAPNAYQSGYKESLPSTDPDQFAKESCTFGMKTIKCFQSNNNPGPGAHYYNPPLSTGPQYSFGTGHRSHMENKTFTDQYYKPSTMFSGPHATFGQDPRSSDFGKQEEYFNKFQFQQNN